MIPRFERESGVWRVRKYVAALWADKMLGNKLKNGCGGVGGNENEADTPGVALAE